MVRKPTKAPTKTTARKTAPRKKPQVDDFEVPAGFQDVSTEYANLPPHDFDKSPMLKGTVNKVDDATVQRKEGPQETQVAHIITDEGEEVALWKSAGLSDLFDHIAKGSKIMVIYTGMEELKAGKRMRTYRAYFSG